MLKVALICGTGATSSFMALRLKHALKERNLTMMVQVYPEVTIGEDIESFDYILLGPHLSFLQQELPAKFDVENKVYTIPGQIYASMDGSQLLDFLLVQMD